jgi:hypothetical protein
VRLTPRVGRSAVDRSRPVGEDVGVESEMISPGFLVRADRPGAWCARSAASRTLSVAATGMLRDDVSESGQLHWLGAWLARHAGVSAQTTHRHPSPSYGTREAPGTDETSAHGVLRRGSLIRARRICVTAVAVLAALAGSPGPAQAEQPQQSEPFNTADDNPLPAGWRIDGEAGARELVWRAPKPVPMGDARVEFRTEDRLLGVPKPARDGRTFRLALDETRAGRLTDLQVTAAGRRLDAAAAAPRRSGSRGARMPAQAPANGVDCRFRATGAICATSNCWPPRAM